MAKEDNKNQEQNIDLLKKENELLKEKLKLQSESYDISTSLVESLKESLGVRTSQTTFEQSLLGINKDISKLIFNQKTGLTEINDIEKQITKNNELRNKSIIVENSLTQQITKTDKSRIDDIINTNKALTKQQNDLAKIMSLSKEERKNRKEEIKDLQTAISLNDEKISSSIENLSVAAQQLLYTKQQRQELEKQTLEREKEKKTLEDQNKLLGLGGAAVGGIGAALDKLGFNKLGSALGIDKIQGKMGEVAEEIQAAGGDVNSFSNKFKVLKSGIGEAGSNLIKSLKDPLSATLFIVTGLIEAFSNIDKESGKVAKNFGTSYDSALGLTSEMNSIANSSMDINVNTGKLTESFLTLNNAFGTFASLNEETLVTFTKLTNQAGVSNEAAIALTQTAMLNNKTTEDTTKEYLGQVAAFKAQTGSAINTKLVLEDIGKISKATALTLGNTPEALAEAAVTARSLGMSIEQVNQAASQLLDFQSSIESELEAELLTGKDLNLEEARRAALSGDVATLSKEISKNIGTAADFSKMNVIQQEALAKSVGMNREDLAKTLMDQEVLTKLKAKEGETAQAAFDRRVKEVGLEKAKKELGDQELANMYAGQSAQEKFAATMEKVKEIFVSLAEPLLPVLGIFTDMFTIIGPIVGLVGKMVHLLAGVGKYVGIAVAGFYTLKFLGDSVYRTTLLSNLAKKVGLITDQQAIGAQKASSVLAKGTLLTEGQAEIVKKRSLGSVILSNIQEKLGLGLKQSSLGLAIRESAIKAKDFILDKGKLAITYAINAAKAIGNTIASVGRALSKSDLLLNIGKAAMGAISSLASIPIVGWALGLAASAAIITLGYKFMKGNDVVSGGYGKRTLLAPEGAISLNDRDTVIAGTDLGGKNKSSKETSVGAPASSGPSIDITPLIEKMAAVESVLQQILAKEGIVNLDSQKVGQITSLKTVKVQ